MIGKINRCYFTTFNCANSGFLLRVLPSQNPEIQLVQLPGKEFQNKSWSSYSPLAHFQSAWLLQPLRLRLFAQIHWSVGVMRGYLRVCSQADQMWQKRFHLTFSSLVFNNKKIYFSLSLRSHGRVFCHGRWSECRPRGRLTLNIKISLTWLSLDFHLNFCFYISELAPNQTHLPLVQQSPKNISKAFYCLGAILITYF